MAQAPRKAAGDGENTGDTPAGEKFVVPPEILKQLRDEAVAEARKEVRDDFEKMLPQIRQEISDELKGAEVTGEQKIRKVDARANSLAQSLANKADQRLMLQAPDDLPKGYVRCVPLKAFYVDGKDIHGASDTAISVEVFPDPDARPIMLREGLAASLKKSGLVQLV